MSVQTHEEQTMRTIGAGNQGHAIDLGMNG